MLEPNIIELVVSVSALLNEWNIHDCMNVVGMIIPMSYFKQNKRMKEDFALT